MSRNKKIIYGIGAVGFLVFLWMFLPVDQMPAEAWGLGFKVRLIGFVAIGLLAFYFFFDRVLGDRKKAHKRQAIE
jgi:hypothetical protein